MPDCRWVRLGLGGVSFVESVYLAGGGGGGGGMVGGTGTTAVLADPQISPNRNHAELRHSRPACNAPGGHIRGAHKAFIVYHYVVRRPT